MSGDVVLGRSVSREGTGASTGSNDLRYECPQVGDFDGDCGS